MLSPPLFKIGWVDGWLDGISDATDLETYSTQEHPNWAIMSNLCGESSRMIHISRINFIGS